jgi:hypothetical protein
MANVNLCGDPSHAGNNEWAKGDEAISRQYCTIPKIVMDAGTKEEHTVHDPAYVQGKKTKKKKKKKGSNKFRNQLTGSRHWKARVPAVVKPYNPNHWYVKQLYWDQFRMNITYKAWQAGTEAAAKVSCSSAP